jgi:Flp pilus assembly protein TadD
MRSSLVTSAALGLLLLGASLTGGSALAAGGGGGMTGGISGPRSDAKAEYQRGMAALQAGYYREAADSFRRVLEIRPSDAGVWYMLGYAEARGGDVSGAERAYARSVALDSEPIEPHRDLAVVLAKLKHKDRGAVQLDLLKARASACHDACPDAAVLKAAIDTVEAALSL